MADNEKKLPEKRVAEMLGPFIGHTTHCSTKIWIYDRRLSTAINGIWMKVKVAATSTVVFSDRVEIDPKKCNTSLTTITGLTPDTEYI